MKGNMQKGNFKKPKMKKPMNITRPNLSSLSVMKRITPKAIKGRKK